MSSSTANASSTKKAPRNYPKDSPETRASKQLAYLLRHGALEKGLKLRDDGSILVSEVLKYPQL
ncbi:tRNA 2'-phosphotransferase, partial [Coemansia aciculifera]